MSRRDTALAPNPVVATSPAFAYSYIRFSTPDQAKGDSLRRQMDAAEAWAVRAGVVIDTALTFRDLGKSAYLGEHRKNPDRYALAAFLQLVESGRVARGSFLVIESLDRLTREHVRAGLMLLLGLIEKGIRIVQLSPSEIIYDEKSDEMGLMLAIVELSRGHRESRIKSERVGKAWADKKRRARAGEHLLTHKFPAWVRAEGDALSLIPERAAVVRRIFDLAANGYGTAAIVTRFTAEKVPGFGKGGRWGRSYIALILSDRRALGEFQPRTRDGKPDGDPIVNYFPAVITPDEFHRVRGAVEVRRNLAAKKTLGNSLPHRGRVWPSQPNGAAHGVKEMARQEPALPRRVHLFAGLIHNARLPGDSYYTAQRTDGRREGRSGETQFVLLNTSAAEGREKAYSFPLPVFERAILGQLREVKVSDLLGESPVADDLAALEGRRAEVRIRVAKLEAELTTGDIPSLARALRQLESELQEIDVAIETARAKKATPTVDAWGACHTLVDALAAAPDPEDTRRRLRAMLARVIEGIWLLVVPRGRVRLAAVRVQFRDSPQHRDYFIYHRPPRSNGKATRPGEWKVFSIAIPGKANELDLRQPAQAGVLEKALELLNVEDMER